MKRGSYHHGDLRRVLLDASLALVNEAGVAELSLREVARKAGVSHNAPYHHFPDKSSLLAAIALEGYEKLALAMQEEGAKAPDPITRLGACGIAYVKFALAFPAHFRVMFRPELCSPEEHPQVNAASTRSLELVVATVVACQEAKCLPPGDPRPYVLTCWSAVHGLSSLWLDGPLASDWEGFGKSPEKLAQMVVSTLSQLVIQPAAAASATKPSRVRSTTGKRPVKRPRPR